MDSSLGSKIASKLYSLDALQKGKLYLKSKTVLPIYLFGPGCCKQRSSLFQQYLAAVKQRKKITLRASVHMRTLWLDGWQMRAALSAMD